MAKMVDKAAAIRAIFKGIDKSFKQVLLSDEAMPLLQNALESIDLTKTSPRLEDIFAFARYTSLDKVVGVIFGQDPYPDPKHAHGLCFSTLDIRLPASLRNVYGAVENSGFRTEVKDGEVGSATPGYLGTWARQGIILLNTSLTTIAGTTRAHFDAWNEYMKVIVRDLGARPLAFLLWGDDARRLRPLITHCDALILEETHPSPLAQNRLEEARQFRHCTHFRVVNEWLIERGRLPIDWAPVPKYVAYTDGSASNNGSTSAKAGYAAWFTSGPLEGTRLTERIAPAKVIVHGEDKIIWPTNIRGEGFAILAVLERVLAQHRQIPGCVLEPADSVSLEIVTDSKFWIQMIETFIPSWIKAKVPLESKENPDLVKRVWDAVCALRPFTRLSLRHVYSHGKDETIAPVDKACNDCVDKWALEARNAPEFFTREERIGRVASTS
jgi:uracil-DNA glycosylase